MKKILVLVCVLSCCQNLFAQKTLYLKPFIGMQNPYCHYDRVLGKNDAFIVNKFNTTDNFGVLLEMHLNKSWVISAGWSKGNIGWGFKQTLPKEISTVYRLDKDASRANYIHRFPVVAKKRFADVGWVEIDPKIELYRFKFDFYVQGGLSIDFIPHNSAFEPNINTGIVLETGDYILNNENVELLHRFNASASVGLGTQFYYNNKPRFDITLFYSQGFRNMLKIDVETEMNSLKFNTRLLTRGAVLGATLGFPIKLITFGKD